MDDLKIVFPGTSNFTIELPPCRGAWDGGRARLREGMRVSPPAKMARRR